MVKISGNNGREQGKIGTVDVLPEDPENLSDMWKEEGSEAFDPNGFPGPGYSAYGLCIKKVDATS